MSIKSIRSAFLLEGKNAIVTGGAKGIGLGITTALAQQGANVAIFARDEIAADKVIADLDSTGGGKISFYRTDITSNQSCQDSVNKYIADYGTVDILVNNAGIAKSGGLLSMDEDLSSWFECFNTDLHGGVRMSYLVCKHMCNSTRGGRIINITSNAGEIVNIPLLTAYAAAKAAFNHFTKCLAVEVAPYKICVNAIAPGFTFSNFSKKIATEKYERICAEIPLGRFAEAIEIGALAVYLASDASAIVTGAIFTADGGYSRNH